jgi:hypothetical protein
LLRLAILPGFALLLGAGCSGINATGSVSPATFLLPGIMQADPPRTRPPQTPEFVAGSQLLAKSR